MTACGGMMSGKDITPTPTQRPTPYISAPATVTEQPAMTPEATNTPAGTQTPQPTEDLQVTVTVAPTQTLTPSPTNTPAPTAANTPKPTVTNTPVPTATDIPEPTATEAPEDTCTPTPTPRYTYTDIEDTELWTTTDLNMRTLPSVKGEKITIAPKNSKVLAIRQCNETGWYEVQYDGKTGYMSEVYLTDAAPQPYLIVIDPGHQRKGNYDKEPNGPGSDVLKAKVSSGTQGKFTRIEEYKLTLTVSLYIKEELEARGYEVVLTRETHDVDISNVERAVMANELGADAFIRIHANGSENAGVEGVETLCQTKRNPYNADLYGESRRLSELVLDEVVKMTGAKKRHVWETDTMTGINWAQVPSTILEMGYMSNEKEDRLMATEEYRRQIAKGVADAIDRYFGRE